MGIWGRLPFAWSVLFLPVILFAEPRVETETVSLLESYVQEVRDASRVYHHEWSEDLLSGIGKREASGLRFHASPFADIPRFRVRFGRWLFTAIVPEDYQGWKRQLDSVAGIAENTRYEMGLDRVVGFRFFPWTERHFMEFERTALAAIEEAAEDVAALVESLHAARMPPAPFEWDYLAQRYLDAWVIGALLKHERERFLSAFPIRGSQPEKLDIRQEPAKQRIGECRVALLRMSNPRYRW